MHVRLAVNSKLLLGDSVNGQMSLSDPVVDWKYVWAINSLSPTDHWTYQHYCVSNTCLLSDSWWLKYYLSSLMFWIYPSSLFHPYLSLNIAAFTLFWQSVFCSVFHYSFNLIFFLIITDINLIMHVLWNEQCPKLQTWWKWVNNSLFHCYHFFC